MKLPAWAKPAGIAAVIVGTLFGAYYVVYARPLARVSQELGTIVSGNNDLSEAIRDRVRVREQLKAFGQRTLSASVDEADARFRSLLSDIAINSGLAKGSVQVNSDKPERVLNPGGSSKLTTRLKDDLKKQVDFSVIKGELSGTGPLDATLRVMAMVKAQPWVHRIESFSIKPEDKDRQKFTLRVTLYTLFSPDLVPANLPEPTITPVEGGGRDRWAGIFQKNVFKEPAPMVVASGPSTVDPPPAAPRPAFEEWRLTGITEGRSGVSALLVNVKNKQSMILQAGSSISEAKFVEGRGEKAVFEIGGAMFEVFNGQTLEQRRPANR